MLGALVKRNYNESWEAAFRAHAKKSGFYSKCEGKVRRVEQEMA